MGTLLKFQAHNAPRVLLIKVVVHGGCPWRVESREWSAVMGLDFDVASGISHQAFLLKMH